MSLVAWKGIALAPSAISRPGSAARALSADREAQTLAGKGSRSHFEGSSPPRRGRRTQTSPRPARDAQLPRRRGDQPPLGPESPGAPVVQGRIPSGLACSPQAQYGALPRDLLWVRTSRQEVESPRGHRPRHASPQLPSAHRGWNPVFPGSGLQQDGSACSPRSGTSCGGSPLNREIRRISLRKRCPRSSARSDSRSAARRRRRFRQFIRAADSLQGDKFILQVHDLRFD
jgi:hypothetical protein